MTSFRDKMLAARPEIADRERRHAEKGRQAVDLYALRCAANLSQNELARTSGLGLAGVRRLESLTGPLPAPEEIARYRKACGPVA